MVSGAALLGSEVPSLATDSPMRLPRPPANVRPHVALLFVLAAASLCDAFAAEGKKKAATPESRWTVCCCQASSFSPSSPASA